MENELKAKKMKKVDFISKTDHIIDITEEEDLIDLATNDYENSQPGLSSILRDQDFSSEDTEAKEIHNSKIVEETRKLINEKNNVDRLSKIIDSNVIAEAKVISSLRISKLNSTF